MMTHTIVVTVVTAEFKDLVKVKTRDVAHVIIEALEHGLTLGALRNQAVIRVTATTADGLTNVEVFDVSHD